MSETRPLIERLYDRIDINLHEGLELRHKHGIATVDLLIDFFADDRWLRDAIQRDVAVKLYSPVEYLVESMRRDPTSTVESELTNPGRR